MYPRLGLLLAAPRTTVKDVMHKHVTVSTKVALALRASIPAEGTDTLRGWGARLGGLLLERHRTRTTRRARRGLAIKVHPSTGKIFSVPVEHDRRRVPLTQLDTASPERGDGSSALGGASSRS